MKDSYKNAHTHIFTMQNAPEDFLSLYLPKPLADIVDSATNTKVGVFLLQGLISRFGAQGKRYAQFLKLGKSKDQLTIFKELINQYPDKAMEIIALTMNMEFIGAGRSDTGFDGQLQQVIDIKKKYPDKLNIFMGIDPRYKGTGTEIRRTVESYFETKIQSGDRSIYPLCGLKIYPSTGFYAFDPKLKETFQWAADNGVPVMTHCYYLGGVFNYSKQTIKNNLNITDPYTGLPYNIPKYIDDKNIWKWLKGSQGAANSRKSCSYFLEPHTYESMLRFFDGQNGNLKICLAHFGGADQIEAAVNGTTDPEQKNPYGIKKQNWFNQVQYLLDTYPGAYTDISYDVAEGADKKKDFLYKTFLSEAAKPYGEKILFGTDYFMTEMEGKEKDTYSSFMGYAAGKTLANGNTLWDQMAKHNINNYLRSKYY